MSRLAGKWWKGGPPSALEFGAGIARTWAREEQRCDHGIQVERCDERVAVIVEARRWAEWILNICPAEKQHIDELIEIQRRDLSVGIAIALVIAHTGTGVANPIAIRIGLIRIGDGWTIVAQIADAIAVRVSLIGIEHGRTVVDIAGACRKSRVGEAVAVGICAGIAGIADAIAIGVGLRGVRNGGAVITGISDTIGIGIGLGAFGFIQPLIGGDIFKDACHPRRPGDCPLR